jgi:hypothetical protein
MHKQPSVALASTAGARWSSDVSSNAVITSLDETSRTARHVIVRYVGFRSTSEGREYTMRVADGLSSREFVLLISHRAFATREARFQDAPDVCSGKLRRALAADPDLQPDACMPVTAQDLLDYRGEHLSSLEKRARVKP